MYKFDINYTNEEYMEYYKNILITRKIVRNVIFIFIFIAISVAWWVDGSDATKGNFIPIFALCAAVILPAINLLYIPLIKRQLKLREQEIKNVHIFLTFEDDKLIYENQTEPLPTAVSEKVDENEKLETNNEQDKDELVDDNENEYEKEEEKKEPQRVFTLHYNNFYEVTATKNLVMMALDRQTVIIIPKRTIVEGNIEEFIHFLGSKIYPSRFKIKGVPKTYVAPSIESPVEEKPIEEQSKDTPDEENKD